MGLMVNCVGAGTRDGGYLAFATLGVVKKRGSLLRTATRGRGS